MKKIKNTTNYSSNNKIAIVCITILLSSIVIFLATSLSLTHSIMQYQKQQYPIYIEPLINYHVVFMIILVIAAIVFGGAAYHVLKENELHNNKKRFSKGD